MFSNYDIYARETVKEIVATGKRLIEENDNPKPVPKEYVITEQVLKPVMTFLNSIDIPIAQMMAMGLGTLPELEDYLGAELDKKES